MTKSFQHEKPDSRVNIMLEIEGDDGKKSLELPMRLLVLGDFKAGEDETPVEDRERININKDNFGQVMGSQEINVEMVVPDRLSDEEGQEMRVGLSIDSMDALAPEAIAQQVPVLRRMVATRTLLQDLRNRLITTRDLRSRLQEVIHDDTALAELTAQLDALVKSEPSDAS